MLLDADAVCAVTFLQERIPRAAAQVHRLKSDGYVIDSRPCSRGHEHHTRQIEYVLEALPIPPVAGPTDAA